MSKILIDASNPENLSSKPSSEAETRKKFMTVAQWAGRSQDMTNLFYKFDKLMREANDDAKRKDISKIGAIEVYKLLGECFASLKSSGALTIPGIDNGELWVDGELVYKGK